MGKQIFNLIQVVLMFILNCRYHVYTYLYLVSNPGWGSFSRQQINVLNLHLVIGKCDCFDDNNFPRVDHQLPDTILKSRCCPPAWSQLKKVEGL